jgi:hypothetical protein
MDSRLPIVVAAALSLVAPWLAARPALAQAVVVKRGFENVVQAPLDGIVAPYTAWKTLEASLEQVESPGGKVLTGAVGYPYYLGFYALLAGFREAAGLIETPLGLALWPVNAFTPVTFSPFFDVTEAPALVDRPSRFFDVKFGGRWLSRH